MDYDGNCASYCLTEYVYAPYPAIHRTFHVNSTCMGKLLSNDNEKIRSSLISTISLTETFYEFCKDAGIALDKTPFASCARHLESYPQPIETCALDSRVSRSTCVRPAVIRKNQNGGFRRFLS